MRHGVTMITTVAGARAATQAIAGLRSGTWGVTAMQDYFPAAEPAAEPALMGSAAGETTTTTQ